MVNEFQTCVKRKTKKISFKPLHVNRYRTKFHLRSLKLFALYIKAILVMSADQNPKQLPFTNPCQEPFLPGPALDHITPTPNPVTF